MRDLLKADLKRALKDKLFMVLCIIGGVFSLLTPLLYKGMEALLSMEEMAAMGALGFQMDAKTMFFTSFSPGNNFGLILPILVAIMLCKDFSHGTIRNKIICGKSRTSVYFSLLLTCIILMCTLILAQALLTLLVSLLLFGYQSGTFTASDFWYLLASIGFEMVVYLFVCALLMFMIVSTKNAGLAIVMYFVVNFVMMIVGAVTQTVAISMDPSNSAYGILEFLNTANVFVSTAIGGGTAYTAKQVLAILLPNVTLFVLFVLLGHIAFRKKDLK